MIYRLAPKTQGNQLRDPRGFSAGHKCGCNQLFGGFFGGLSAGGVCANKVIPTTDKSNCERFSVPHGVAFSRAAQCDSWSN